jgi:hypothetical protein
MSTRQKMFGSGKRVFVSCADEEIRPFGPVGQVIHPRDKHVASCSLIRESSECKHVCFAKRAQLVWKKCGVYKLCSHTEEPCILAVAVQSRNLIHLNPCLHAIPTW